MKVTVCIGSSCHIKGSRGVVNKLQQLINLHKLDVELEGSFCMEHCQEGVCVTVDKKLFSVSPETVDEFFEKEILANAKVIEEE